MNARRAEIEKFLDQELLPQVNQEFAKYRGTEIEGKKKELAALEATIRDSGMNPDNSPKVQGIREELAKYGDNEALANEVFSHLTSFFRRYYDGGDFLSLRRYKKDTYAIPYEGEEVKLHWANADQYYIKTSEYLKDYAFKLANGKKAHFKLVDATQEKDNIKAEAGKERKFKLYDEEPIRIEDNNVFIQFVYLPDKEKQDAINKKTVAFVNGETGKKLKEFYELFASAPTARNPQRTLWEKHLYSYTARFNFDFFIHKDLGGFLRRELDFYIKNEVLFVDDLDAQDEQNLKTAVAKVKVIKHIALKIIAFLAQLEDFQKKLWLKKKFVVSCGWCVTLDRVPETLYPEIITSDAQREEWVKLFAIDEIEADLVKPGFSQPLTIEFLKANPYLVLDTKHFDAQFKEKLLASFDNLDETTDGVIINSENFQALNLLQERYRGQVGFIHIDPPYNTASSGFIYKNAYQHSSWLTLIKNRLELATLFMTDAGVFACHIDEIEMERLHILLEATLLNNAGTMVWDKGMPTAGANGLATQHEYVLFRTKGIAAIRVKKKNIEIIHSKIKELFAIYGSATKEAITEYRKWLRSQTYLSKAEMTYDQFDDTKKAFRSDNMSATDRRTNDKFYIPLKHPLTNEDCPVPEYGWRYTPESLNKLNEERLILFGDNSSTMPRKKTYMENTTDNQMPTIFRSGSRGKLVLDNLGFEFPFAHPLDFYNHIIDASANFNDTILDFFSGSGTTGHATINLNREDGGKRKYVLVEMGDYFNTILKPRIQKVVYSKDWKDGKPVSREGSSHMFKYMRLESYDDTLDNLQMMRTESQQATLENMEAKAREDYMLSYMLDVETRAGDSLLNIDRFSDPFSYTLKIRKDNELKDEIIDLVETFNYLIGLYVEQTETIRGFKVVCGRLRTGEKTLVIWRNAQEKSNEALDDFFKKQKYNTLDFEFDLIFVNGDNNLENLKVAEDKWKVRLIEEEFKKRMWESAL